jgi:Outer membrane protein beta-barrel domain
MKKIILLYIFAAFAVTCMAQQPQFNFFAGPQLTSSRYLIQGKKQPTTNKYGFHAGIGVKVPFENNLYFSPVAYYSLKGYKVKFNRRAFPPDLRAVDNNTTIHTFELGALLQYDLSRKPNHFFLKLGPSLDFQLFGKEKFKLDDNTTIDRKMVFSFGDYGHYAASALVVLGYETANGLIIAGQYSYGLGSINNADNGPSILHSVLGLSVGKYLSGKK